MWLNTVIIVSVFSSLTIQVKFGNGYNAAFKVRNVSALCFSLSGRSNLQSHGGGAHTAGSYWLVLAYGRARVSPGCCFAFFIIRSTRACRAFLIEVFYTAETITQSEANGPFRKVNSSAFSLLHVASFPEMQRPTHQGDKGARLFLLFPPSCPTSVNLDNHRERWVRAAPRLPVVTDDSCALFANEDGCRAWIIKHQCAAEYFDIEPFMNNSSRASSKLITLSSINCRGRCRSLFFVEVGERDVGHNILSETTHLVLLYGVVSKRRREGAVDLFGRRDWLFSLIQWSKTGP